MNASDPERLRIVSHELRSPVAALTALADAAGGVDDRAVLQRLVALAVAAARDVERLVGDPDLFSMRAELVDVEQLARSFAGPTVAVSVDGSAVVRGDSTRLRQAVSNLVRNGLRHGTHVAIDVSERDGLVVVWVTDDGPGMDIDDDPFSHGTTGVGSTGYGLWLARRIAEAHGGSLELVDRPGDGARLRLALPPASASL